MITNPVLMELYDAALCFIFMYLGICCIFWFSDYLKSKSEMKDEYDFSNGERGKFYNEKEKEDGRK